MTYLKKRIMKFINVQIYRSNVFNSVRRLDANNTNYIFLLGILCSLVMVVVETLFALSLQRFLASVNLVPSVAATRFFGTIQPPTIEALVLFFFALVRFNILIINNYLFVKLAGKFELAAKKNLIDSAKAKNGSIELDSLPYYFNDVATSIGDWLATTFQWISKFLMSVIYCTILFYYSQIVTLILFFCILMIVPLQKILSARISQVSKIIHNLKEKMSKDFLQLVRIIKSNKTEFVEKSKIFSLELNRMMRSRISLTLASSMRNQIPAIFGIAALILISYHSQSIFLDNKSEVVPYIYLLLRTSQSAADVTRLSSYLRVDMPRITSYFQVIKNNE